MTLLEYTSKLKSALSSFSEKDASLYNLTVEKRILGALDGFELSPKEVSFKLSEYIDLNFKENNLLKLFIGDNAVVKVFSDGGSPDDSYRFVVYPENECYFESLRVKSETANLELIKDKFVLRKLFLSLTTSNFSDTVAIEAETSIGTHNLDALLSLTNGSKETSVLIGLSSQEGVFPGLSEIIGLLGGDSSGWFSVIKQSFDIKITSLVFGAGLDAFPKVSLNSAIITTEIDIGALVFESSFSYPDCELRGEVTEKSEKSFAKIAGSFGISNIPDFMNKLSVAQASVGGNLKEKSFFVNIGIDGELELLGITFTDIKAELVWNSDSGFKADMFLAMKITNTVYMSFHANLSSGSFVLSGSANFSGYEDFFWDILFKDCDIPDWVKKIELSAIYCQYGSNTFVFSLVTDIDINGSMVEAAINFEKGKDNFKISGKCIIGERIADIVFNSKNEISAIFAKFDSGDNPLLITPAFFGLKTVSDTALTVKKVGFAVLNTDKEKLIAFGAKLGASIDFGAFPLVGTIFKSGLSVTLENFAVYYNSRESSEKENNFLKISEIKDYIKIDGSGVSIEATLKTAVDNMTISTADKTASDKNSSEDSSVPINNFVETHASLSSENSIKWFNIRKKFGFITVSRIGMAFENPNLAFYVDGGITLGCFECSLIGLSINTPLTEFSPRFSLSGIAVLYDSAALSVSGSIVKSGAKSFDGSLSVKISKYNFSAVASFGETENGDLSFFAYLEAGIQIAVSPSFIIKGFSGAFGYDEKIKPPSFYEVDKFPLLTSKSQDIAKNLKNGWLAQSKGELWAAAGVKFSAFELVEGNFALIARFGNDLTFDLAGLAELTLPKGSTRENAYVYAELQMAATLRPNEGVFGIAAVLSDKSFLFSKDCKLTGGLAFFIWFGKNPNAGDFVFTIGGYHPNFMLPAHYPVVPRAGFSWTINKELSVKGEAYLAVTPSCVMAGGRLEAVFESGPVRAWFIAYADFLMAFDPFAFTAELGISIGVSVKLNLFFCTTNITLSAGVNLKLWGTPIGGTAIVHLSVISFSIDFGSKNPPNSLSKHLSVDEFKKLLPVDIHSIQISSGLIKKDEDTFIVGASNSGFVIQTALPVSACISGTNHFYSGKTVSVRPMEITSVSSELNIEVNYQNSILDLNGWCITPVLSSVSEALWGEPLYENTNFVHSDKKPSARLIKDICTGFEILPPPPDTGKNKIIIEQFDDIAEKIEHFVEMPIFENY